VVPEPDMHHSSDSNMGCAILRNLPVDVVDNVKFKKPGKNTLNDAIWYKEGSPGEPTEIVYDEPDPKDGRPWKYGKLITKSSHHKEMGTTIIKVGIQLQSLSAQMTFVLDCIMMELHGSAWALRLAFVCIFLVKWGGRVYCANALAKIQIEQDPGDHVRQVTARDCLTRLGFATFFNLFDVPTDQTDLPMQTHIKKPAQPFVVFRSREGIRAWIVGWLSRSQHEVESQSSKINNLRFNMFDVPLMLLKLGLAGHLHWSASVISAIFWSVCTSAWALWDLWALVGHRVKYHKALTDEAEKLKKRLPSDWNGSEDNLSEPLRQVLSKLRIVYRNLGMFFGEKVDKRYQLPSTTRREQASGRRANPADEVQPEDPIVEQANLSQRMQQEGIAAPLAQPPQVGLRGVDAHGAAAGSSAEGVEGTPVTGSTVDFPTAGCPACTHASGGAGAAYWQAVRGHYLPNQQPRQRVPRMLGVVAQAMAAREVEEQIQQDQLKKMSQHDPGDNSIDPIWLAETCMTTLAGPETAPAEV